MLHFPNRKSRAVYSGHWVPTRPTPLAAPLTVDVNKGLAAELGLDAGACASDAFARLFSGDVAVLGGGNSAGPAVPAPGAPIVPTPRPHKGVKGRVKEGEVTPWSTPYAVSVFGSPIPAPDPFDGHGYGDGRAITLGQFTPRREGSDATHWELQLKGAGPTPFARRFDGRAVLRSSVREYLVAEAMHQLGVPTTRALSLIASSSPDEVVPRAWYPQSAASSSEGGARKEHYPNSLIEERCAIVCRASPSFVRCGSFELFSRRAAQGDPLAHTQLEQLLVHTYQREMAEEDGYLGTQGAYSFRLGPL